MSVNEVYLLQMTFCLKIMLYFFLTFCTLNFGCHGSLGSLTMRNYLAKAVALLLDDKGTLVLSTLGSYAGISTVQLERIIQLQLGKYRITLNHTLVIVNQ